MKLISHVQPVICRSLDHDITANETQVWALIDSGSEFNTMTLAYVLRLGLQAHHTNTRAQKIDRSIFQMFGMVLADFQVKDKLGKARFFQETFLLADICAKVVLGMLFLILSNVNVQFVEKELSRGLTSPPRLNKLPNR